MKTIEIFIDESGDIRRHRPMNITGIAVLAPSVEARDGFHGSYLEKRRRSRRWKIASSPRPKQIHFLADYVSNGVFNENVNPNTAPYKAWFDRGFVLSSVDEEADRWLSAVRAFANGDRVTALKIVNGLCKMPRHQQTKTYHFFHRAALGWTETLTTQDLKRLFTEV